jgi:hypothetical protein
MTTPDQTYGTLRPPTPQVAPTLPLSPVRPTIGPAPSPTPYGTFTAPDPSMLNSDPSYQYDLAQQQKGIEKSAAARGTLLTGGLLKRLQENASGVASRHFGDIFGRALDTYRTNRDTNAQNFGQGMQSYTGSLAGSDRDYGAARDVYGDARETALRTADVTNANAGAMDEYARFLEAQRAAGLLPPEQPPPANPFARRDPRLGTLRTPYAPMPTTFGG